MPITPDTAPSVLAQPLETLSTPNLLPQPVTAPVATAAPAPTIENSPSVQALSGNPTPTPVRFGHFQRALINGANEAAANDPNANAPGSWARHLVAGAGKALSNGVTALGDVSTKPGGGALAGIAETLANRNQRLTQQKEYADKQAQLAKENDRADTTLNLEKQKADDLHAYSMVQTLNMQKASRNLDRDFQESQVKTDDAMADMLRQAHREELTPVGGISESEYEQNFGAGKKYDPSKTQPLHTGWTTVEKNGKEVVEPRWSIFSREHNQEVPVDKEGAAILANGPAATRFKEGSVVDGDVLYNAIRQVGASAIAEKSINNSLDKLDEEHAASKKIKDNATDLSTIGPFLTGKDFIGDVEKIVTHVGKDGKPTPEAQAGQRLLTNFFTEAQIETHRKDLADEQIKKEEADFKNAAKNEFKGDATKLGQYDKDGVNRSYLSSLNPDEQGLITDAGTGRLGIERWDYLLSHSPDFASAVANTFKNFDSSKIKDYIAVQKDLTTGAGSVTLSSGGTAFKHLKDLLDNSNVYGQFGEFSKTGKKRDEIIETLAPELIKFYSGSSAKPGEQETKDRKESLRGIFNRRDQIKQAGLNALNKLNDIKQKYANAAPSQQYQAQMPWISPQAQHDLAYILNDGKEPSAEQIAAIGPNALPPRGLNQENAPAFQQSGQPSQPAQPGTGTPGEVSPQLTEDELSQLSPDERAEYQSAQTPPEGIPSHAVIVTDPTTNIEYYGDPTTKKIFGKVPVQSSQIAGMAAAARQSITDARHKEQTHGTGR